MPESCEHFNRAVRFTRHLFPSAIQWNTQLTNCLKAPVPGSSIDQPQKVKSGFRVYDRFHGKCSHMPRIESEDYYEVRGQLVTHNYEVTFFLFTGFVVLNLKHQLLLFCLHLSHVFHHMENTTWLLLSCKPSVLKGWLAFQPMIVAGREIKHAHVQLLPHYVTLCGRMACLGEPHRVRLLRCGRRTGEEGGWHSAKLFN